MKSVFLLAGRTGGPFFPLPAFAKYLENCSPIYIGVKNSFEQTVAQKNNLKIEFLPEVKLGILSFKKQKPSELIANIWSLFTGGILFIFSLLKSVSLLIKYKPKLIITTGSFLTVPIVVAFRFTNFLKFTNSKLVVHQQDPEPGIANKFGAKYAHFKSCVFQFTKENFPVFSDSELIFNPTILENYEKTDSQYLQKIALSNKPLYEFMIEKSSKPLLFIFGGGGGSEDLNVWLRNYFEKVIKEFRVIHLLGVFQKAEVMPKNKDYYQQVSFIEEMIPVMALSDLVICRGGMGSITESRLLQTPTFLVPLPHSHQELNTKLVADEFAILDQKDRPTWLSQIKQNFPKKFISKQRQDIQKIKKELQNYFSKLNDFLDK